MGEFSKENRGFPVNWIVGPELAGFKAVGLPQAVVLPKIHLMLSSVVQPFAGRTGPVRAFSINASVQVFGVGA